MRRLLRPFGEPGTYGTLLFLLTAIPVGSVSFALLCAGWGLTIGLCVTPLVVPALIGLALLTRGLGAVERALAKELLGVEVDPPPPFRRAGGFWARSFAMLTDRSRWKEQAYLFLRFLVGLPVAVALLSLLSSSLWLVGAPIHYRWSDFDWIVWRIDRLGEAALLVPVGVVGMVLTIQLVRPLRALAGWLARKLLSGSRTPEPSVAAVRMARRRVLAGHGLVTGVVSALLLLIWALSSRGYVWPAWPMIALGLPLAIHAWIVFVAERSQTWRTRGARVLAGHVGVSAAIELFLIAVWALSTRGYFWPAWTFLGLAATAGVHAAAVVGGLAHRERIEELETTRAGAVDIHESELRRIERDLHDGAQARLVALGMSIGMAEQKLESDPVAAGQLLAEARHGAREALEELRDLARGIHPPVLGDRGLEAALAGLAARSPVHVTLSASLAERPPAAVETAAYFVVAEALANAGKHADATQLEIRIRRADEVLVVEVVDDGRGGADPSGHGLTGLRQRVEALDGTLAVDSPRGGPTTVRARLPCAS
jgi:signal transduction histidine kinase